MAARALLRILARVQQVRWLPPPLLLRLWQLEKKLVWDKPGALGPADAFDVPAISYEINSSDDLLN